jgi:predicted RNA-binding protein with TRAM domain
VHLHDDEDAIARRNGYVITVTGASARVGETVRVRIEQAGRTSATAVLADGTVAVEPESQDGEAPTEEPKPKKKTRRGSRGGRGRKKKAPAAPPQEADAQPEQAEEVGKPAAEEAPAEEASAEEQKPKKKTRRGSRGGRGRKKKTLESPPEAGQESPLV